jgi:hypothetical protein
MTQNFLDGGAAINVLARHYDVATESSMSVSIMNLSPHMACVTARCAGHGKFCPRTSNDNR